MASSCLGESSTLRTVPTSCWLLSFVLLSSCGSDKHASPVPASESGPAEASAYCSGAASCCASRGFAFDRGSCEQDSRWAADTVCPPLAIYDPQAAGDCYARRQAALASCQVDPVWTYPPCRAMCKGTVPVGHACADQEKCIDPPDGRAFCSSVGDPESAKESICTAAHRGKAGDPCAATWVSLGNSVCISGPQGSDPNHNILDSTTTGLEWVACHTDDALFCGKDEQSGGHRCRPMGKPGERCEPSDSGDCRDTCEADAFCSDQGICVSNADGPPPGMLDVTDSACEGAFRSY